MGLLLNKLTLFCQPSQDLVRSIMEEKKVPGMSMVVIRAGKPVASYALGLRSLDTREPVTTQTVFDAASLSKTIFAYAVLKLAGSGKLDLDKPLSFYMDYPDLSGDPRSRQVTARMVLSHTGGLPNWRGGGELQFAHNPGQQFQYSGEGFVWLSRVVEKITGKAINDWLQETVLQPLGMTHSSYKDTSYLHNNYAWPHEDIGITRQKNFPARANVAYSLQTTAEDYSKFLLAYMEAADIHKKIRREMFQPQTNSRMDASSDRLAWALGVGVETEPQGTANWQWGDNGTFKALLFFYPATRDGLVYFTNSYNGLAMAPAILEQVFPGPHDALKWLEIDPFAIPNEKLLYRAYAMPWQEAVEPWLQKASGLPDTTVLNEQRLVNLGNRLLELERPYNARELFGMAEKIYPQSEAVQKGYAASMLALGFRRDSLAPVSKGPLVFELAAVPYARKVSLVGSFNNWDTAKNPMQWVNGRWTTSMDLPPGSYEYKFVVDGIWFNDPANPRLHSGAYINSVLDWQPKTK